MTTLMRSQKGRLEAGFSSCFIFFLPWQSGSLQHLVSEVSSGKVCSHHSHKLLHRSKAPQFAASASAPGFLYHRESAPSLENSADIRFIEESVPLKPNKGRLLGNIYTQQYMGGCLEISTWHPKTLELQFCDGTFASWPYQTGWWRVAQSFLTHRSNTRENSYDEENPKWYKQVFLPPCFGKEIIPLPFLLKAMQLGRKEWSCSGFHGDRSPTPRPRAKNSSWLGCW